MPDMAFKGTYSDWKLIKTRGVVQVVFEVPLQDHDAAYQVLGGMPDASAERWFGIAPLNMNESTPPVSRVAPDKVPAQQAGMVCQDPKFWQFLNIALIDTNVGSEDEAAQEVRDYCCVGSRSEIRPETVSGDLWNMLYHGFLKWKFDQQTE